MSIRHSDKPDREGRTTSLPGEAGSADLAGISELFGLKSDGPADATRTSADTAGRWVSATEGTVYGSNDPSGRLVHGRYRLIAELGSGGMGVTYRAWDTQAGIPVVVKMPKREVRHDREVMARFAREITAMQAVPHESIVPITDSGDDDGCPFVVMRFLPGGSLADYRRRDESGKPIKNPPGMLFYWLPGVAAALDRIHARRMLHRDVKPGNIFLDGFLKPYLGDFGIAKVVDESGGLEKEQTLTATKMAVGTPEYMAPELFKPKAQPDGRVDQYALAVTVYEMLSGEKPFTGSTAHIVVEHSSLPVPPLEKKCPGLRPSAYAAVHKALAKKPEERFGTCEEFAAAVLAEITPLEPEVDTIRLLCPSCRNILKLPQKAAGTKGRCPRCQSVMDVAEDLGSLWLDSEERGEGLAVPAQPPGQADETQFTTPSKQAFEGILWFAIMASFVAGIVLGELDLNRLAGLHATTSANHNDQLLERTPSSIGKQAELSEELMNVLIAALNAGEKTNWVLSLSLTTLTDRQAEALAKHEGPLCLDSLATLTDAQAEALAKHEGTLSLDGLAALTDAQVKALAWHQGVLFLRGLTTLTDAQAEMLANHEGDLNLNRLTSVTDKQAEALSNHEGHLFLNGPTTLTDRQAEAFAKHKGSLHLDALTTLTDRQAEALAKHVGDLSLPRLTTLTDSQAKSLVTHEGRLSLDGLTTLSDKAAATLRSNPEIRLPERFRR